MAQNTKRAVTVLGATGSIGDSTLDVIRQHSDKFSVYALSANRNAEKMAQLCMLHQPAFAVMADAAAADQLRGLLQLSDCATEVLDNTEHDSLEAIASAAEVDVVVAAIVGAAGLGSALAAANAGKRILLANKEALVMSGELFMQAVERGGAELLPVDSEHNAIFQCMPPHRAGTTVAGIHQILLTASGGPFRNTPLAELAEVTPDQACAHPNWSMGRKISVDSATMMNKGLELIEACLLFGCGPDKIQVLVHPQSVVHSMVEYVDGSTLAQLGAPDMRTPIAHALGCTVAEVEAADQTRLDTGIRLNFLDMNALEFEAPDEERFPALRIARQVASEGGLAPAIMNAANEVAVASFLAGKLRFLQIAEIVEAVLQAIPAGPISGLQSVLDIDAKARTAAAQRVQ